MTFLAYYRYFKEKKNSPFNDALIFFKMISCPSKYVLMRYKNHLRNIKKAFRKHFFVYKIIILIYFVLNITKKEFKRKLEKIKDVKQKNQNKVIKFFFLRIY